MRWEGETTRPFSSKSGAQTYLEVLGKLLHCATWAAVWCAGFENAYHPAGMLASQGFVWLTGKKPTRKVTKNCLCFRESGTGKSGHLSLWKGQEFKKQSWGRENHCWSHKGLLSGCLWELILRGKHKWDSYCFWQSKYARRVLDPYCNMMVRLKKIKAYMRKTKE